jgi:hypothetical protein
MDRAALSPLLRSFERHLRAENRSEHTIASYLESLRQAEAFLAGRGRSLADARRGTWRPSSGSCSGVGRRRPSPPAIDGCGSCTDGWRRKRRYPPAQWRE